MKITLIGAGSREFGPATLRDLYLSEVLAGDAVDIVLMDRDATGLERTRSYADTLRAETGRPHVARATTDLVDAVEGADFVVVAIEVRRYFYWAQDFHVPRLHGFDQIYGENGGPGGLFHALRNMGPSVDIARAVAEHAPDAWLLNYTNPLTKLCEAQTRLSSTRVIGLCHGVLGAIKQLGRLLEMSPRRIEAYACGLNHFTWFQEIRDRETGEDLYPRLREREREAHWLAEWDEIALSRVLFRVFGLYPSPGANHIGEYVRWAGELLVSQGLQFFYDPRDGAPWEPGAEVPTWIYNLDDDPHRAPLFPDGIPERIRPSREARERQDERLVASEELAVPIIEGIARGAAHDLPAVNVPNRGAIPGLPDDAVVEVPATVGPDGLVPRQMDALPEGVAALLRTQISIHRLLVDAFHEGSRDLLLQAVLLDPTCSSYRQAVHLVDRMFELQGDVLPQLSWARR